MFLGMVLSAQISTVEIIDSKKYDDITYVIVDDCIVPVQKRNLKDLNAIVKAVDKECNLELDKP